MRYGHVAVGLAEHGNALEAGQKQRFSERVLPANACLSECTRKSSSCAEVQLRRPLLQQKEVCMYLRPIGKRLPRRREFIRGAVRNHEGDEWWEDFLDVERFLCSWLDFRRRNIIRRLRNFGPKKNDLHLDSKPPKGSKSCEMSMSVGALVGKGLFWCSSVPHLCASRSLVRCCQSLEHSRREVRQLSAVYTDIAFYYNGGM